MSTLDTLPRRRSVGQSLPLRVWRWLVDGARERRLEARRRWLRHTTEVELSKLPPEVRKDIGWPTRQDY